MDQNLLREVKEWVSLQRIPEIIQEKRTPDRVMEVLRIAGNRRAILNLMPFPLNWTYSWVMPDAIERCQKFLKITAVGLAYAHYITDGFSAQIEFPNELTVDGERRNNIAIQICMPLNKIIFTPRHMFSVYMDFDAHLHSTKTLKVNRTTNEKILGLPYGTAERFCLMTAIEEGLHAALEVGPGKDSPPINYKNMPIIVNEKYHAKSNEMYTHKPSEQKIQKLLPKIWQDFGLDRQYGVSFGR